MMNNAIIILVLFYFLTGCNVKQLTHQEIVTSYYDSRDNGDFKKLKTVIADSITIIAGDYTMPYTHDSFYEVFKWDSIFKPSYTLVALQENGSEIRATVAYNSIRNVFLKNGPMTCQYKIAFHSGKISEIKSLECTDVDWSVWQKERDSLVKWTKENHPRLDGFIHEMTMDGALDYLKAIELYKKNHESIY